MLAYDYAFLRIKKFSFLTAECIARLFVKLDTTMQYEINVHKTVENVVLVDSEYRAAVVLYLAHDSIKKRENAWVLAGCQ